MPGRRGKSLKRLTLGWNSLAADCPRLLRANLCGDKRGKAAPPLNAAVAPVKIIVPFFALICSGTTYTWSTISRLQEWNHTDSVWTMNTVISMMFPWTKKGTEKIFYFDTCNLFACRLAQIPILQIPNHSRPASFHRSFSCQYSIKYMVLVFT